MFLKVKIYNPREDVEEPQIINMDYVKSIADEAIYEDGTDEIVLPYVSVITEDGIIFISKVWFQGGYRPATVDNFHTAILSNK